jgi:hypothetical protein
MNLGCVVGPVLLGVLETADPTKEAFAVGIGCQEILTDTNG